MAQAQGSQGTAEKEVDELLSDALTDEDSDEAEDGFAIDNPLEPYVMIHRTTRELHSMIHQGQVDLNPPYQRGKPRKIVWNEPKQSNLITSIFQNYYVPPIVFSVMLDEDGEEIRVCVDGKQRLTSIQKFVDGAIPYRYKKKSFYFSLPPSQRGKKFQVPDWAKEQFLSKIISCAEYKLIEPNTERAIFQRVQLGVSLSAAEKLQAIPGEWALWISELQAKHVESEHGLGYALNWTTKRGADFQGIAQLVYCCDDIHARPMPTPTKLDAFLRREVPPSEEFRLAIEGVLHELWHIANSRSLNRAFKEIDRKVAPVEFVFIGVVLYVMREAEHEEKAQAIYDMRVRVKKAHNDVRMNQGVIKTMWEFIDEIDDMDDDPAYRAPKRGRGRPRKTQQNGDDSSDEEYSPRKRRA